jgi:hypothetical protein
VKRLIGCGALALMIVACAAPPRATEQSRTSTSVEPTSVEALVEAIAANAQRSEHESDPKIRGELALESSRDANACLAREPQAAACLYGRAIAVGLEARVHAAHAAELLNSMLQDLASAEAADPNYDQAGPARVRWC